MNKRLTAGLAAALAICAFVGVSSASAATEFGSGCAAEEVAPLTSLVSVSGTGNPLPAAAPTSGVIAEWKLNLKLEGAGPEEEAELARLLTPQLEVFKPAGENRYTMVGEARGAAANLHGISTFAARIPVQAGDVLGLGATPFTAYCETADTNDVIGGFVGSPPVGTTVTVAESAAEAQVPVVAKIEPDVDGDGYGDETQDQCPQSAAYQTACPVVTISSLPTVGKKAVVVHVATSLSAPVSVTATVALGKGKTASLTAAGQTVAPGVLTPFTLTLTPPVTKALKALSIKKSLTMSIVAGATNVTGSPSTTTSSVKLKGQAKPVHHKKKSKKKKGKRK